MYVNKNVLFSLRIENTSSKYFIYVLPFQQKDSPWQGAIRSVAAIWSTQLKRRQRVSNQLIHISDWLPTFAKIAGVNIDGHIDGKSVWTALSYDLPSPRREILAHHDSATPYMAYISDRFKLISGTTYDGMYDRWLSQPPNASEQNDTFGENYSDAILASDAGQVLSLYSKTNQANVQHQAENYLISKNEINEIRLNAQITCNGYKPNELNTTIGGCNPIVEPCLFDILRDPCETTNVASTYPDIVVELLDKLDYYGKIAKPIRNQPFDPRCDPANFGGIWTWWYDELNITSRNSGAILI